MTGAWGRATIGELCQVRPPKSEARQKLGPQGLVSFAGMEDLGIDRKFLETRHVRSLSAVDGSYTYFADGDVLLAKITPCFENGKLGIAADLKNGVGFGSSEFIVLRPTPKIDKEFLYYFLSQPDFRTQGAARMGGAVGQQRVPREFVEGYPIPVPPVSEQRRIVGILDKALAAIAAAKANTEKSLEDARALFQSELESVFTRGAGRWPRRRLGDLTTKIGSGATPLGGERVYLSDGVPLIRSLNVHDVGFKRERLAFLGDSHATELDNVTVQSNDVLLNITGASIARCCVVPSDVVPARVNQHVSIVRPAPGKLDSRFLHYLLVSKPYKDILLSTGEGGGSTRQALTKTQIENFSIVVPDRLDEQREVVSQLVKLESLTAGLEANYLQKVSALDGLKRSLLGEAFSGRL